MTLIKNILNINWYLKDFFLRLYCKDFNEKLLAFTKGISKIDSISDFNGFADYMKRIPELTRGSTYTYKRVYGESTLYGYAYNIIKYAGFTNNYLFYCPLVEHGIPYNCDFDCNSHNRNASYIFQGRYAEKQYSKYMKYNAYYIGPYIHYCKSFYNTSDLNEIKSKLGKTILLFLPHSIENQKVFFNIDRMLNLFCQKNNLSFHTIIICVYCQDVLNINNFNEHSKNYKFVSAGFKIDRLFANRLRSIIDLADYVLYDTFSSSIGYSFFLNKTVVSVIDEKIKKQLCYLDNGFAKKIREFDSLFSCGSEASFEDKFEFIDYYWGLKDIKTKSEIREIINTNKLRIRQNFGF